MRNIIEFSIIGVIFFCLDKYGGLDFSVLIASAALYLSISNKNQS